MEQGFNAFRDIRVLSQVAGMMEEGTLGHEIDLYAFYAVDGLSSTPVAHIFGNAGECYAAMFSRVLEGGAVSDVVSLMDVARGTGDVAALQEQILTRLEDEQGAAIRADNIRGALRVAVLPSDDALAAGLSFDESDMRVISGFAWGDGDDAQVYCNAFLPRAWEAWRAKQRDGFTVSPLMRKSYRRNAGSIDEQRARFEQDIRAHYATMNA